ncbi:MAG: CoA transferase [Bacteroidetes bacterium]|nr:CoA transferase [Bacteroidota bacterium]
MDAHSSSPADAANPGPRHPDPSPRTPLPLQHLNVLELASVLAGPSVGSFLAELGAHVTKVENRAQGGDVTRSWKTASELPDAAQSAYYASVNWNKTTFWADFQNPQDLKAVVERAAASDIVLASFRAGDDRRYGLDPDTLLSKHPALIYGRISGFGPHSRRPAYDLVLQAETGWMAMNGLPDHPGVKLPVALVDVLAAHQLKQAVLLALLERERSGSGGLVEVSLYDAAISGLANQASNYLMTHAIPGRLGSLHPNIAPYGEQFMCRDDVSLVLAVGSDAQFRALCTVLDQPETAHLPDFALNQNRVKNRGKLSELLQPLFELKAAGAWLSLLEQAGVPAGQVLNLAQVFDQAEAKAMVLADPAATENGGLRPRQVAFYVHPSSAKGPYKGRKEIRTSET